MSQPPWPSGMTALIMFGASYNGYISWLHLTRYTSRSLIGPHNLLRTFVLYAMPFKFPQICYSNLLWDENKPWAPFLCEQFVDCKYSSQHSALKLAQLNKTKQHQSRNGSNTQSTLNIYTYQHFNRNIGEIIIHDFFICRYMPFGRYFDFVICNTVRMSQPWACLVIATPATLN